MVRILGNNLLNHKKIDIALTSIYGIGLISAKKILNELKINNNLKVSELTDNDISRLRYFLETKDLNLEGKLKKMINLNIKRLILINCYRGKRHLKGLPTRGQRTRTNSRTSRKKHNSLIKI